MAINAQDVTRAFYSPLDYGSLVTQSLEQQRKRELEDAQLAQQQEDRDIKRAQLFNETLSPLNKDTGTYYDNLLHNQMSDFYTKEYPEFMKANPKAKLGQQIMFANQYVGGLAHKAEQAKQLQTYAKAYAKNVAQDVKGVDEAALANSLEKSAYESGDIANDWSDVLRNKAGDMDFITNHYKLNEDAIKRLNETVNSTAANTQGGRVTIGKKIYETTQGAPTGFEFDYTAGKSVPKVEQVDIPTVRMNGLTPIPTVQQVGLVPMKTVETYISHPEFHYALNKEAYDLSSTDELAKNMDAATLTRYAATKLLGKISAKGAVNDKTDEINRSNEMMQMSRDAAKRAAKNDGGEFNDFKYQANIVSDAMRGSDKWIKTFPKENIYVENGLNEKGGVHTDEINASLLTKDLPNGVIDLAGKDTKIYRDGGDIYAQDVKKVSDGNYKALGSARKLSLSEAADYEAAIRSKLVNKYSMKTDKPSSETTTKAVTSQAKPVEYNVGIPTIQLDAMDAAINQVMSGKKGTKKTK